MTSLSSTRFMVLSPTSFFDDAKCAINRIECGFILRKSFVVIRRALQFINLPHRKRVVPKTTKDEKSANLCQLDFL